VKVKGRGTLLDFTDLPVNEEYVAAIARHAQVKQRSRWFNATSIVVHPDSLQSILSYPFVSKMELVGRARRERLPQPSNDSLPEIPTGSHAKVTTIDYGLSLEQLSQIGVPAVHDSGNFAQDVMIGVFDNGFRLLQHEVFDSLRILATYDFVDKKTSVVPNNPSTSFGTHGVNSLSVIGGYKPGQLVGAAFGATFILGRTENDSSETPLEEDNWVAAIEWADSMGVDVTSTSLIYREYDPPYGGWTWEDMDGNTTMITRAADMAVAKGILVVNSAGNFGNPPVVGQNTLGAPADADSVLTVGAVDVAGQRGSFSSVGPTTSVPQRIKPDVMARGVLVSAASGTNPTGYIVSFTGTSAACPLAAGAAALVLNRFPDLDPLTIIDALRRTASNAATPDNLFGWGIINAAAAIMYLSGDNTEPPPASPAFLPNYPNPFNSLTRIPFGLPSPSVVRLEVFDVLGQSVTVLLEDPLPGGWHEKDWNGTDRHGVPVASGVYLFRLSATTASGTRVSHLRAVLAR
jgi:subtilisin family serine protease